MLSMLLLLELSVSTLAIIIKVMINWFVLLRAERFFDLRIIIHLMVSVYIVFRMIIVDHEGI